MTEINQRVDNGLAGALNLDEQTINSMNNPNLIYKNASPYILSLHYIPLANTYKSNGFAATAVDLPVSDAFRDGGFEIDSDTLSADEIQQLEEKMSDMNDIETLKDCLRWGRLYGGGCILINTEQKADTPFNPETIKGKEVEFLAVDRWQCIPLASSLYLAEKFMLQDNLHNEGEEITFDKSRVLTFTGKTQPYYLRNLLQGWGASIFEDIIPQLNQYLKANGVILELLDEAKIDILKISGLSDLLMSSEGEAVVRRRVDIAAANKNYKSMLTMDANDDYDQKQLSFGSIDQMLEKIFLLICSCLRIPYSKIFGRGASGFSSGEDDLENYNAMINSDIRVPATKILKQMIDIRCYQLFGRKIPDLTITWKPLRVMSEKDQQEIETQKINSYIQLLQAGILSPKQVAEKLAVEKIFALTDEEINALSDEVQADELTGFTEENVNVNNSLWSKVQNVFKTH